MLPTTKHEGGRGLGTRPQQPGFGQGVEKQSGGSTSSQGLSTSKDNNINASSEVTSPHALPSVSLPTAGGSIRGIGEKFSVNPATGTGSFSVPISTSPGRGGHGVQLSLSYDSGSGNGPFAMGWSLSNSSISRKTDKGLPQYRDDEESDVFLLSGAEDLVPVLEFTGKAFGGHKVEVRRQHGRTFNVHSYQPRIEGSFQRIQRFTDKETGETHWEVKTPDNSTMVFGDTDNCRIFNPENPLQVFEWLPSRTYDEKGNLSVFEYKAEDSEGVSTASPYERSRTDCSRSAHRYIKSIKYGNTVSRVSPSFSNATDWLFEVVFDYGEHDNLSPTPSECRPWLCRADPFSSRRSGFEIRQYRLCRRVLMFHHFPEEPGIGHNCVVSSFHISYETVGLDIASGLAITTTVKSVSQESWKRDGDAYVRDSFPPLEFTYSAAKPAQIPQDVDSEFLTNLPVGFNDTTYQLVDLEGQGLAGAVSKVNGGLVYVPNNGEGEFGQAETLQNVPASVFSQAIVGAWMDLSGDGKVELVKFDGPTPGFYSRNWDEKSGWDTFSTFRQLPNISWVDRNVKFIDVTGDGLTDVLVLDDNEMRVYYGMGKEGFGDLSYSQPPLDEDQGPRLLFWDGVVALYTSDMTGDGLSDLVRIRHCEVSYWPNLGYGRFGAKIIMEKPPEFDNPSHFDQSLLRLADVDGTGTTDLIYLGGLTPMIYHNLSGNGWSDGMPIHAFPSVNSLTNVEVVDLLGKGTGCLVWSSSLPGDSGRQIRYLDLMDEGKPYLLVKVENNSGLETRLTYTSSSIFFARDKRAGRHWISHLPFPVQCVEKSETVDRISGNIFTSRYAYHDGYFDGTEREFRGFGMVESWDTEQYSSLDTHQRQHSNVDMASHIPPILTKTWYHTGQYQENNCSTRYYSHEYYRDVDLHPNLLDVLLSETTLPSSIKTTSRSVPHILKYQEQREAYRALKGSMLRSEVYSVDGSKLENIPISVSESSFALEQRQPLSVNKHAVFFVHGKEVLEMLYDRKLFRVGQETRLDPRVEHSMTLEVDFFGNPLRTMAINYGRRYDDPNPILTAADRKKQRRTYSMTTETTYTNMIDTAAAYVLPAVAQTSTFEVVNVTSAGSKHKPGSWWVDFESASRIVSTLSCGRYDIPFENFDGPYKWTTDPCRRMIKKSRSIYRKNDLSGPLPLGTIESMMLPFKNHGLVFTDDQVSLYIASGKFQRDDIESLFRDEGAYIRFPGEEGWWSNGTEAFYSPNRNDTAQEELQYAKKTFFFLHRSRIPWHTDTDPAETTYTYDKYHLLAQHVIDPYNNTATIGERDKDLSKPLLRSGHDYRLLMPFILMDANRNRVEVTFDVLGNVVASATRGKPEDEDGDNLTDLKTDLRDKEIKSYFHAPLLHAARLLSKSTSRTIYDLHAFYRTKHKTHPLPNWSSSITRETHTSELQDGDESRVFVGFSYVDGTGRPIQAKAQCEPGPLEPINAVRDGKKIGAAVIVHHRWLTSSWIIYNNKGNPVRNYEPFFSDTHHFEDKSMRGVSPMFIYDALSRNVAIINPDHSWSKIVFSPWDSRSWDKTDTVLNPNPAEDPDVGSFIRRFREEEFLPTWYSRRSSGQMGPAEERAAKGSAFNAGTPSISYFDAMGRDCVKFETLRSLSSGSQPSRDEILRQVMYVDIQGLPYKVVDTLDRTASRLTYTFAKSVIREEHMDNGEKWTLKDVAGNLLRTWNGQGQVFRPVYDKLRRVTALYLKDGRTEYLVEKTEQGESQPNAETSNSRGRVIAAFDQSGVTRTPSYNFKGNLLRSTRQLSKKAHGILDWCAEVELDERLYEEVVRSNALNKVTKTRLPDGTETVYTYNDRGMQQTVSTTLSGDKEKQAVIKEIDYDAKGQRTRVVQGNGVETRVQYDTLTFKTRRIITTRLVKRSSGSSGSDSDSPPRKRSPGRRRRIDRLQDLRYVYDTSGNITNIEDDSKQTVFFRNHRIEPSQSFKYDSLYRLVEATGREHAGQMAAAKDGAANPKNASLASEASSNHVHDGKALARYVERYEYDSQGNILALRHETLGESHSWTRHYQYKEPSSIIPSENNNRLSCTRVGRKTEDYRYDGLAGLTGSMTSMPSQPSLEYDYRDKLVLSSSRPETLENDASSERTCYSYDATGKRVRKVTEKKAANGDVLRLKETIYIGGAYEIFRRYSGSGETVVEVHSLSIAESGRRLLLIDNRTVGSDTRCPSTVYRYQLANHQGSATMEVDQDANILSYEEYTPYGISSLRFMFKQTEAPKRYRFLGKEQDSSGLYHLGARYYAAWLGRFTSADPKGAADGLNLYQYAQSNPVMLSDPGGTQAGPVDAALGWTQKVFDQRNNLLTKALGNVSNTNWMAKLMTNNNVFGNRATKDFARFLQNEAGAGMAEFETYYRSAVTGGKTGSSNIDIIFRESSEAWEHKLVSVKQFFKKSGDFRKGGEEALKEVMGDFGAQMKTATANMANAGESIVPKLGITMKGVEEGGKEMQAFVKYVEEALPGTKFIHEMAPTLVKAREEVNVAANIMSGEGRQLMLTGTKVAKVAGKAGKVLGKVAKVLGPVAAVVGVLTFASSAYAATTGKDALAEPEAGPLSAGDRFQNGLDAASGVTGLASTVAAGAAAKGLVGAGVAAGAAVTSIVVGGAGTGAMVGSYVADKLEKPLQEHLGEAAGAGVAAGTGVLAGAAAGAAVGAIVGSIVPGVGTAVGAAVGGVAGAVGAGAKILIDRFW